MFGRGCARLAVWHRVDRAGFPKEQNFKTLISSLGCFRAGKKEIRPKKSVVTRKSSDLKMLRSVKSPVFAPPQAKHFIDTIQIIIKSEILL
jgi:hypothetical protein